MRAPHAAAWLRRRVAIDLRTLAAFRVALGGVLLADLAIRAQGLVAFHGEDGVLPRDARLAIYGAGRAASAWDLLAGSPTALAIGFGVAGLAALALAIGYRTRAASLVSWIAVQGFVVRAPEIATGGDHLLAALLLWGLFLPLGARASLDAIRRPPASPPPREVADPASAALVVQIAAMMVLSGASKLHDPTWRAGDGVHVALHAEFYATALAHWLRQHTGLIAAMTPAVLAFEIAGPLLLLSPWRPDLLRLGYGLGLVGLNLGFWLCLRVGVFSWVAMAGGLVFVPGSVWDRLAGRPAIARASAELQRRVARWRGTPRPTPTRPGRWRRRGGLAVLALLGLLTIGGNLRARQRRALPASVRLAILNLALEQRGWPMFAPTARDFGWFEMPATLADGRRIDLYTGGGPLGRSAPALLSDDFPTYRWRKLFHNLRRFAALREGVVDYRCRAWNAAHAGADQARTVEIVYHRRENLADGAVSPVKPVTLIRRACGAAIETPARGDAGDAGE